MKNVIVTNMKSEDSGTVENSKGVKDDGGHPGKLFALTKENWGTRVMEGICAEYLPSYFLYLIKTIVFQFNLQSIFNEYLRE